MSDNDDLKVLLALLGLFGGIWAVAKILKSTSGGERQYRLKQDVFGFQRGDVVTHSQLLEAVQAEVDTQGVAEPEYDEEEAPSDADETAPVYDESAQEQWYRDNGYEKCDCGVWSKSVVQCNAPGCRNTMCDSCGWYSGGYCSGNCQSYDD